MKTEKQVRTWWLDDTQERLDNGKTIVFEGHTTEPKNWQETNISFKVIAHEDHLEIVKGLEARIQKLREALEFYGLMTASFDDEEHNNHDKLLIRAKRALLGVDNGKKAREALKQDEELEC